MIDPWRVERIFLTVKAYPSISKKHGEASCMAGITTQGHWIRLYPVPFRDLSDEQKFPKYSWIEARIRKSTRDFRVESHGVDADSITPLETIPTSNNWSRRNAIVLPKVASAEWVFRDDRDPSQDSLALIKPTQIIGLEIDKTPDEEFHKQIANLNTLQQQVSLFDIPALKPLELVPYSFRYTFIDDAGRSHKLKIVDWEIYQLYRNVQHRDNWEDLVRHKYETEFKKRDLYFFLGTTHVWPKSWIIIGVYYPTSSAAQSHMFDGQI